MTNTNDIATNANALASTFYFFAYTPDIFIVAVNAKSYPDFLD